MSRVGAIVSNKNHILVSCFVMIAKNHDYHDKWITDDTWIGLIKQHYETTNRDFDPKHTELNMALSRDKNLKSINMLATRLPNTMGIYKAECRIRKEGRRFKRTAYYITKPNNIPLIQPGGNAKWYDTVVSVIQPRPNTRSNPEPNQRSLPGEVAMASTMTPSPSKRGRRNESPVAITPPQNVQIATQAPAPLPPILGYSYWESTEAWQLFGTREPIHNEDLEVIVERRIQALIKGYTQPEGWKQVLDDFGQKQTLFCI